MTTKRVEINLTAEQYNAFKAASKHEGIPLAAWIRYTVLKTMYERRPSVLNPIDPVPTPALEAVRTINEDEIMMLEAQHYRRGREDAERELMERLVREGRVKPKSDVGM